MSSDDTMSSRIAEVLGCSSWVAGGLAILLRMLALVGWLSVVAAVLLAYALLR